MAASAPTALACLTSSMASRVELEPAPAITGTRPAAVRMHRSTTRRCSSWERVAVSPVVPTGTRPWTPPEIWRSMRATKASSSTAPSRKGVTRAGITPLNKGSDIVCKKP